MQQQQDRIPGVYRELASEVPETEFRTGVPAFLGLVAANSEIAEEPVVLTRATQFAQRIDRPLPGGFLEPAVRGFFENGGHRCVVVPARAAASSIDALTSTSINTSIAESLSQLEALDDVDLVCAPDLSLALLTAGLTDEDRRAREDLMRALQVELVGACARAGHRSAILDTPPVRPGATRAAALTAASAYVDALRTAINDKNTAWAREAAIYFPWVCAGSTDERAGHEFIPPSGHVAGVYARVDDQLGFHRAPAGVHLESVFNLSVAVDNASQAALQASGINCLRAFPGRGLRVWGARTLSRDDLWRYVNVRRLIKTIARWLELKLGGLALEPNNAMLWNRVMREVDAYLGRLHERGALKGRVPAEAYYVKCDDETNPPEVRDAGMMITEIGVAPLAPQEFITVRLMQRGEGLTLTDAIT